MENENIIPDKSSLEKQIKNGANWFFWIAALSLVNAIIIYFGVDRFFIIGLGSSLIVNYMAKEIIVDYGNNLIIITIIANIIISGIFVLFGVFGNKKHIWAFFTGIIFYILDGMIFVFCSDMLSTGFHVFALV
jgi:hypothetical protein